MKNIILVLTLLFDFSFSQAQTGLQFSQVKLIEVAVPAGSNQTATVGTVPAGKVWKLENAQTVSYSLSAFYLLINGNGINYSFPYAYAASGTQFMNSVVWYPAGTTIGIKHWNGSGADNMVFNFLEFTVVP